MSSGEGNGNPLQCSCLENPRDRGAWWAAVHWVAQSQTRLKRRSSSRCHLAQSSTCPINPRDGVYLTLGGSVGSQASY